MEVKRCQDGQWRRRRGNSIEEVKRGWDGLLRTRRSNSAKEVTGGQWRTRRGDITMCRSKVMMQWSVKKKRRYQGDLEKQRCEGMVYRESRKGNRTL